MINLYQYGHCQTRHKSNLCQQWGIQQIENLFLTQLQSETYETFDEETLNKFYQIVYDKESLDFLLILFQTNILKKVRWWLEEQERFSGGMQRIHERGLQQILELILNMMKQIKNFPSKLGQTLQLAQNNLSLLFNVLEQSKNKLVRTTFVQCISQMFKLRPGIINYNIYAQFLAKTYEKVEEFYHFIDFYFSKKNTKGHQQGTTQAILIGFEKRMDSFSKKKALSKKDRKFIQKSYLILVDYLHQNTQTNIPEFVLNKYGKIFYFLQKIITKQFNYQLLSDIYNTLIEIYMNSRICNIEKFKFVLGLYKSILHKSATLFALLKTEPLLNAAFLDWLFETEITTTRAEDVRECYFKNVYSLEFLIVMALYYLDKFPENIYKIAVYMRNISLLEDNKDFLDNPSILEYMQHFHEYVHDGEYFRHFIASLDYSQLSRIQA